jgi:hypothetical protein
MAQLLFGPSIAKAGTFTPGEFISYGQVGFSNAPAAGTLSDHFSDVYSGPPAPFELIVGGTTTGSFQINFDSAGGVQGYFPSAGLPGALTASMLDPQQSASGVYGGDVVALALDIDFDNAGFLGRTSTTPFADLVLTGLTGSVSDLNGILTELTGAVSDFNGMSVSSFLALSEQALGGGATAYSYRDLDNLTGLITTAFANGTVQEFATDHLDFPQVTNPQLPILSPTPLPNSILLFGSVVAGYSAFRRWRS